MRRELLRAARASASYVVARARPKREPAVPEALAGAAGIPGMEGVRYRAEDIDLLIDDAVEGYKRERDWRTANGETGPMPAEHYLAVSGGGENGAFGAGLLLGWTENGTRPEFSLVTGISTGALTAPFAFLGPDYDNELKTVYTTIGADDVMVKRGFLAALNNDAMADNQPLWQLVSRYVDKELLQAVAREHNKGRMLLIATTNLDARASVIWNMGKIAASRHPDALHLFRKVLIASTAVPGAFPPVMIDVEADGRLYQEMHVDGGVMAQVFLYPTSLNVLEASRLHGIEVPEASLYIIRNAQLDPNWASVKRQTVQIAQRSIETLTQMQGYANLFWIYAITQRDDVDYNLAFIGPEFDVDKPGPFDTGYMNALYDHGYALGRAGYDWRKTPPGLAGAIVADTN